MVEIAAGRIAEATGARLLAGDPARICRGCVIDSRQVTEGSIFVAFPGERVDGNSFAPAAVEAGAACVVLTEAPADGLLDAAGVRGCAVLMTEDPTEFLLRLARDYRRGLDCTVVGVTGSIGKTTTKDALAALLATRYRVHATRGNLNNLIGLPLTILSAPRDTQAMVLEMGMNHPHEIERLAACARPSYGIITKVGTSHIGILGSRENIARAKAEIVGGMVGGPEGAGSRRPVLVLHGEDDFTPFIVEGFAKPAGVDVVLCGSDASDDVTASNVALDDEGRPHFDLSLGDGPAVRARLSVPGAQSVPNALFAAAVAHRMGVGAEAIAKALGDLRVTGRRQEIRRAATGARVIDDSYNASPESMAAGLDLLAELPCTGSRIAVLGEMGEMGAEAERLHALTGAYAAAKKPSLLLCVGGALAATMAESARLMGMDEGDVQVVPSTDELIGRFPGLAGADDLMLVKGSRFVGLDRYVEEVCSDAR